MKEYLSSRLSAKVGLRFELPAESLPIGLTLCAIQSTRLSRKQHTRENPLLVSVLELISRLFSIHPPTPALIKDRFQQCGTAIIVSFFQT